MNSEYTSLAAVGHLFQIYYCKKSSYYVVLKNFWACYYLSTRSGFPSASANRILSSRANKSDVTSISCLRC